MQRACGSARGRHGRDDRKRWSHWNVSDDKYRKRIDSARYRYDRDGHDNDPRNRYDHHRNGHDDDDRDGHDHHTRYR
ncbi:MAG: hypothetical protein ABSG43_22300, partial [Solirubrobacteraceae bacterium]